MPNTERSSAMIELLRSEGAMSVKSLAEHFDVSEMTVRRDLRALDEQGIISMMHGIAFFTRRNDDTVYDLIQQLGVHCNEKNAIGRAAAALITPQDSVYIDCGSTASAMLPYIPDGAPNTFVCSGTNVLFELQKKEIGNLIFTGGFYHAGTRSFESEESVRMLSRIRTAKAFITAAGVSQQLGLTCLHQYEVPTKQTAVSIAMTRILLADSSKFGLVSPAFFAGWESIDIVISDWNLSPEWEEFFAAKNITLIRTSAN